MPHKRTRRILWMGGLILSLSAIVAANTQYEKAETNQRHGLYSSNAGDAGP